ncbi:MAG: DUF4328 domain-containing protein [Solirubrobacteraceae bacterium]
MPETALPLSGRATAAIAFLGLTIVGAVLSLWADANQTELLGRIVEGERVRLAEAQDSDDRVGWTAIVYSVGFIPAIIAFLLWYSRAYRNVIALRITPRYGTRWAVWYWFIPIVSLFRPKQVMNDIWRGSDPDPAAPKRLEDRRVSPLLHWWWALWLLSFWVGNFAFRAGFEDGDFVTDAASLRDQSSAYAFVDGLDIIAGILAILVVRKTTARIEALRQQPQPELEGAPYAPVHGT